MNYQNHSHAFPSAERPAFIENIRAEIRGIRPRPGSKKKPAPLPPDFSDARYLFTVCTGNRWMELGERLPPQKPLFGDFWRRGELCILFAAANAGKSILAVQIGDALSRCRTPAPFAKRQCRPVKVLYIDFELGTTQFYSRYNGPGGAYSFSDNFIRAQFNPDPGLCPDPKTYNDMVFAAIEQRICQLQATVLIIDNITCLRGGTESAVVALRLMQSLKALKASHNLSILVLAHTPKRRPGRPLTADDLHGSKLLVNFADSAFTIGASRSRSGLCYLKQIKQRNTEQRYGEDNVCLCRIARRDDGFLRFRFEGYGPERPHLSAPPSYSHPLAEKIIALSAAGLGQRQISRKLHVSPGLVNGIVRKSGSPEVRKSESPKVRKKEDDVQMCGCADVKKSESPKSPKEGG